MQQDHTLDIRAIPPVQRHPLIFQRLEALAPGESFVLVNDHDPKPLNRFWSENAPLFSGGDESPLLIVRGCLLLSIVV
jgi:uncharacterized protein (DUF2249 family)